MTSVDTTDTRRMHGYLVDHLEEQTWNNPLKMDVGTSSAELQDDETVKRLQGKTEAFKAYVGTMTDT
eukprot:5608609-Prorocentrum_lima.AAC.1